MTIKKLLLGSAAAMLVGGAAQAADLSVAEPIDYVRVCDAFGNTYWYSPGTDTCLSVTGYVRLDARFGNGIANPGTQSNYLPGDWKFNARAALAVQARSMTEWGPLVGYMRFEAQGDRDFNGDGTLGVDAHDATVQEYYASLGNFLVGFTESTYAYGYNVPFRVINNFGDLTLGNKTQVRFGFAAGGWGVAVGLEDPRERALSSNPATMDFPDIAARLTGNFGVISGQLSAGYGSRLFNDTWGVQLGLTADLSSISAGDQLRVVAAWSDTGPEWVSGNLADDGTGTYWAAMASFTHVFNPNWGASIFGSYASGPISGDAWQAAFVAQFTPVTNFTISGELGYQDKQTNTGAFNGTIRFQRSF